MQIAQPGQDGIHSESRSDPVLDNWYLKSRHQFVASLAAAAARATGENSSVLDAGCGSGAVSRILLECGFNVTSCDADAAAVQQAIEQGRLKQAHVADVAKLPFENAVFDSVVCSEVLEHVPDDSAALRELLRVARGPVVISVPAHDYLWTASDTVLGHYRRYSHADLMRLFLDSNAVPQRVGRCHAIPGLGIAVYKVISRLRGTDPRAVVQGSNVPNAMRFRLPGWFDAALYACSHIELLASRAGIMPWGSAWWAVLRRG